MTKCTNCGKELKLHQTIGMTSPTGFCSWKCWNEYRKKPKVDKPKNIKKESERTKKKKDTPERELLKSLRIGLIVIALIFFVLSIITFFKNPLLGLFLMAIFFILASISKYINDKLNIEQKKK